MVSEGWQEGERGEVPLHRVGDIVRDMSRGTVAQVTAADAGSQMITLSRPSGCSWTAVERHCRAATDRDMKDWDVATRLVAKLRGVDAR